MTSWLAQSQLGGLSGMIDWCGTTSEPISLFSYGFRKGSLEILSVIIGVLSTQTYLQAIISARDAGQACKGALLSAALIPPIGILAVIVGLTMKQAGTVLPASTAQAFPLFIKTMFSPPVAAIFMSGLFFIVLGTGAGLALGVTTNLAVDFLEKMAIVRRFGGKLLRMRILGGFVLGIAALIVLYGLGTSILMWSYLSMGLRGSSILPGMLLVVLLPKREFGLGTILALGALPLAYILAAFLL